MKSADQFWEAEVDVHSAKHSITHQALEHQELRGREEQMHTRNQLDSYSWILNVEPASTFL